MKRIETAVIFALLATLACASGGPAASPGAPPPPASEVAARPANPWPVKTREHVDLWLHGYALLQEDTTLVPYFRRGYRARIVVAKNRANVVTQLDANTQKLRARLTVNPALVNAQFLPLSFDSWDELSQAVQIFLQAEGDPGRAQNREVANVIATLAAYFPTSADRDWLRLYVQSLQDERNRFYHSYWLEQQRERANVLTVVDTLWQRAYRPKLQRFLNNTGQTSGEILLSLPLDGEGRSQSSGKLRNTITVSFPDIPQNAVEAIYVIAHEAVATIGRTSVDDNITPTERRSGIVDRYMSAAAVRGGLLLLESAAPELADGYARYYLKSANRPVGANPRASLNSAFPLPEAIRDALSRQLEVVLGGI